MKSKLNLTPYPKQLKKQMKREFSRLKLQKAGKKRSKKMSNKYKRNTKTRRNKKGGDDTDMMFDMSPDVKTANNSKQKSLDSVSLDSSISYSNGSNNKTNSTDKINDKMNDKMNDVPNKYENNNIKSENDNIKSKIEPSYTKPSSHFLINNKEYKLNVLKTLCSESGVCLDIGGNQQLVKTFFYNFNFVYSMDSKRIGAPSASGAVAEVPFYKEGFTAYTALKIATTEESDNLMYEFIVGSRFINKYVNIFPCFCETYKFLKLQNLKTQQDIIDKLTQNKYVKFNNGTFSATPFSLTNNEFLYNVCKDNELFGILIQYFKGFRTLYDDIKENKIVNMWRDSVGLLYQGYFALDCLRKNFTHYDLHFGNLGYYMPYNNKYIIMVYHSENNKEYRFPTRYITKIIDYGRSYYKTENEDTRILMNLYINNLLNKHKNISSSTLKNSLIDCGIYTLVSIRNEKPTDPKSSFHWINPYYKNESHDLRAIANFQKQFKPYYNLKDIYYKEEFGTPENTSPYDGKTIKNVADFRKHLEELIDDFNGRGTYADLEDNYRKEGLTIAGEMHVYNDGRPYEWIKRN